MKIFAKLGIPGLALGVLFFLFQKININSWIVPQEWQALLIFVFMLLLFVIVLFSFYMFKNTKSSINQAELIVNTKFTENNHIKELVMQAVNDCHANLRLASVLEDALSENQNTRRTAHIKVRKSTDNVRRQFLKCMMYLVNSDIPRVRGEAYYCLGEISIDLTKDVGENFFVSGFRDKDLFVKACCANVISRFIPLKSDTVELLRNELSLAQINPESDPVNLKLTYYLNKTLIANESFYENS